MQTDCKTSRAGSDTPNVTLKRVSASAIKPLQRQESHMLRKLHEQLFGNHALRLDAPSVAQGGLAFLLAYVIAYAFQAS